MVVKKIASIVVSSILALSMAACSSEIVVKGNNTAEIHVGGIKLRLGQLMENSTSDSGFELKVDGNTYTIMDSDKNIVVSGTAVNNKCDTVDISGSAYYSYDIYAFGIILPLKNVIKGIEGGLDVRFRYEGVAGIYNYSTGGTDKDGITYSIRITIEDNKVTNMRIVRAK